MDKKSSRYVQITAYIIFLALFVLAMGIANNCGRLSSEDKEGFSKGDTIDIAILFGPGGLYIYEDTLAGINKEIATYFNEETGTPIKIWPINEPERGLSQLEKGAFDILASLPLDNNLKKDNLVSESVFLDRLVLIQLKDSVSGELKVHSSLDLNGKSVYVVSGSSATNRLKNLSQEIGGRVDIIELPEMSDELLCLQVISGDIPIAVVNEKIATSVADKYPNLHYDNSIGFTQFQVWVFNRSDSLVFHKFNTWFEKFKQTEEYGRILEKY